MSSFTGLSRTVSLVTTVIGGIALAGVGVSAALDTDGAFGALLAGPASVNGQAASDGSPSSVDVDGVTDLTVDSRASSFEVLFGDVDEAELSVQGEARSSWTLGRDGDELVVANHRRLGDFCLFGCFAGNERVTLTLPPELEGRIDADLTVQAGALDVSGDFLEADLELGAGSLSFEGAARELGVEVGAGEADIEASDVTTASFELSSGRADATLTGDAPGEVALDVAAGKLDLTLPDTEYRVEQDVSAGSLDNDLQTSDSARHRVIADVSAGAVSLQPGPR